MRRVWILVAPARILAAIAFTLGGGAGCTRGSTDSPSSTRDRARDASVERAAGVVIAEAMALNWSVLTDKREDTPDWIELANRGDRPVDLGGWTLTDSSSASTSERWALPERVLAPGARAVVLASGRRVAGAEGSEIHAPFRLARAGERIALYDRTGVLVDQLGPMPAQVGDLSWGREERAPFREGFLERPTPGAPNAALSSSARPAPPAVTPAPGVYGSAPLSIELSSPEGETEIRYTLDGSDPSDARALRYEGPIAIARSSVLRARVFRGPSPPSDPLLASFLLAPELPAQRGEGLPDSWGASRAHYAIDGAPQRFERALRALPSLSIALAPDDLFGPRGLLGEEEAPDGRRAAQVELLFPDGSPGFSVEAGLLARSELLSKRSFTVAFSGRFAPERLRYPIFRGATEGGTSASASPTRLVLRAGEGSSFLNDIAAPPVYTHDQLARDLQLAMSGYAARGRFVHLFLNGLYWGVYVAAERPDADFAASTFGGDPIDWLSINHKLERSKEVLGERYARYSPFKGSARRFLDLRWTLEHPEQAEGRARRLRELVDLEAYADYVILSWYLGLGDGLDNNWYAAVRTNPPGRLVFFVWDAEYALARSHPSLRPPSNAGAWVHPAFIDGTPEAREFGHTTIVRLWRALREDPEFAVLFADRVHHHLRSGGALSEPSVRSRWAELNDRVRDALALESARWSALSRPSRTFDRDWWPAVVAADRVLAGNTERFVSSLRARGLYPPIDPPVVSPIEVARRESRIALWSPHEIVYTLDGSDPRAEGGSWRPAARVYVEPIPIPKTERSGPVELRARARSSRGVSALVSMSLSLGAEDSADDRGARIREAWLARPEPDRTKRLAHAPAPPPRAGAEVACRFGLEVDGRLECHRSDGRGVLLDRAGTRQPRAAAVGREGALALALLDRAGAPLLDALGEPLMADRIALRAAGEGGEARVRARAESAALGLYWALGFAGGASVPVERARCLGCGSGGADVVLEAAAVEPIGARAGGWTWPELHESAEAEAPERRAEIDAFALLAAMVQTSSRAREHPLLCAEGFFDPRAARCGRLVIGNGALGSAFGDARSPREAASITGYRASRVFAGAGSCAVSIAAPPGRIWTIGEPGRRLLATRLAHLDRASVRAVFEHAQMNRASRLAPADRPLIEALSASVKRPADVDARLLDLWTDALLERAQEIQAARCGGG